MINQLTLLQEKIELINRINKISHTMGDIITSQLLIDKIINADSISLDIRREILSHQLKANK
jgi:hypothetical protein